MNKKDNKQKKDNYCHNEYNCSGKGSFESPEKRILPIKTETETKKKLKKKLKQKVRKKLQKNL